MYNYPTSLLPDNEAGRLEKLRDYQILDTHIEDTFDKLALMASQVFNAQSAFISFVDRDRVFLKSNLSLLPFTDLDRGSTLSSLVILNDDVMIVNDTHSLPDFVKDTYVALEGGMRFFAGAPLKSPEGYNVGAICIGDAEPGEATETQVQMLKTLSKLVIDKLENRLRYRKSIESHINLMNIALHEIKNPLASIKLANEVLRKDDTKKEKMSDMIKSSVTRIQAKLADLLRESAQEESEIRLSIEEIDLNEVYTRIHNNFDLLAQRKNQTIEFEYLCEMPKLHADKIKLLDILHNLVSNAIKYSYYGSSIKIITSQVDGNVMIEVKDEGQGLNKEDVTMLFTKFAKLSSKPTGKETSNGLGLSITKSLVELHNGTITAKSAGKGKGTSFIVSLPVMYIEEPLPQLQPEELT